MGDDGVGWTLELGLGLATGSEGKKIKPRPVDVTVIKSRAP